MAAEYQIYLRDDLVDQNHSTDKRMTPEITELLNNIVPTTIVFKRIHQTKQGFIVTYSKDSDVNYIFDPLIINRLKEKISQLRLQVILKCIDKLLFQDYQMKSTQRQMLN